jgi:hypothetical protein
MKDFNDFFNWLDDQQDIMKNLIKARTYESELDDEGPDEFAPESIFEI